MPLQAIINALLIHLAETTIERDAARAEVASTREELDMLQIRLQEIEAQLTNNNPAGV